MSTRFEVGDITIHRIVEQEQPFFDPLIFFPKLDRDTLEENRSWMQQAGALDPASGLLTLCMQSYVVRTPHHTILIDTCIGNDKDRPGRPIWHGKTDDRWVRGLWHRKTDDHWMRGLAEAGLGVEDIDYVMCTHLHVDHVGWNTRLENGRWVPTFPKARYVFNRKELDHWTAEHAKEPNPVMVDSVLPVVEAGRVEAVEEDHALGDHVRLTPTPGHTPGHVAVEIGKGRTTDAVFTGDLIHSPLQARYPELSMRVDTDQAQSAVTRRRFLECHCEARTLLCTAHFPSPSYGRLSRWNDGFRFETA
jgi:glyoxylase-like metal-dependent hydrolase (beta-lactamase superfamily II)